VHQQLAVLLLLSPSYFFFFFFFFMSLCFSAAAAAAAPIVALRSRRQQQRCCMKQVGHIKTLSCQPFGSTAFNHDLVGKRIITTRDRTIVQTVQLRVRLWRGLAMLFSRRPLSDLGVVIKAAAAAAFSISDCAGSYCCMGGLLLPPLLWLNG
jgi:hypothetical protein